jgi:hypothetical protein
MTYDKPMTQSNCIRPVEAMARFPNSSTLQPVPWLPIDKLKRKRYPPNRLHAAIKPDLNQSDRLNPI